MPEWKILLPIWRALPFIVFIAVIVAAASYLLSDGDDRPRAVRAELLMRFGYEYSPPPTNSSSDRMQVDVDADQLIGTEMQILTSIGLVDRTLTEVPLDAGSSNPVPGAEDLLKRIAVKRVEGSNVLVVEIESRHPDWARDFLAALIRNYLEERDLLFRNAAHRAFLEDRAAAIRAQIVEMDRRTAALEGDVIAGLWIWQDALPGLRAASQVQPAAAELLEAFEKLRLRVSIVPELSRLSALADQVIRSPVPENPPSERMSRGAGAMPLTELDALNVVLQGLTDAAQETPPLVLERGRALDRLTEVDAALLRLEFREGAEQNIQVLTPPYQSRRPIGLSPKLQALLAGLTTLLAGMVVAVAWAGLSAPHPDGPQMPVARRLAIKDIRRRLQEAKGDG